MIFSNDQAVPNRCILARYRLSDYWHTTRDIRWAYNSHGKCQV